ncbi:glutathione S- transferase, nitrogen catabolite repression regulator [Neurospora sp. IMI 360204]|nr:glutathione S- transferase, nitrogen catabolite repression regulator [Neurospora sp. IMI 360204]
MADSSNLKPIKLYGHTGPNPPKVYMLLTALGLPFALDMIQISEAKNPDFVKNINPNGRLPAIHDPNTDLTLWESGAILEYLTETYDKEHKLSFAPGTNDFYLARQWLYFQTTGQGPYYGQIAWFKRYHPEPVPSAVERYVKELHRVTAVMEGHLQTQKDKYGTEEPWFVGNKFSYVDIAFVPWQYTMRLMLSKDEFDEEKYPLVHGWMERLMAGELVKKALEVAFVGRKKEEENSQRGVYPAEDFTVKKYGLNMLVSANDHVRAYIKKIMSQLDKWMVGGKISKLVIVITDKDTGEHVERWQFDPSTPPQLPHSHSTRHEAEIQAEIAAIFRQITASVTFLPQLSGDCTFNALVYADADSDVPVEWGDSDAKEIVNGES